MTCPKLPALATALVVLALVNPAAAHTLRKPAAKTRKLLEHSGIGYRLASFQVKLTSSI